MAKAVPKEGSWLPLALSDSTYSQIVEAALPHGFTRAVDWRRKAAWRGEEAIDGHACHLGVLGRCIAARIKPELQKQLASDVVEVLAEIKSGMDALLESKIEPITSLALRLLLSVVEIAFDKSAIVQDVTGSIRMAPSTTSGVRESRLEGLHAIRAFDRALALDATLLPAIKGRDAAANHIVNRYHFAMINDSIRNAAFKSAIERAVCEGHKHVLDIGAGSGLLSLYAAYAGAESVHAVEVCPAMATACESSLKRNKNHAAAIRLLKRLSTDLTRDCFKTEVPTLLVSEVFDACLLGEDCIKIIEHAKEHLLPPQGSFEIIPHSGQLFGCLVESEELSDMVGAAERVLSGIRCPAAKAHNVQFSPVVAKSSDYVLVHVDRLRKKPRPLSDPVALGPLFNFNTREPLPRESAAEVPIPVNSRGRAHAFLVWFSLDMGGGTTVHTCPFDGGSFPPGPTSECWGQAVFALPDLQGIDVDAGTELRALARTTINRMEVTWVRPPKKSPPCSLTLEETRLLNSGALNDRYARAMQNVAEIAKREGRPWELWDITPQQASAVILFASALGARKIHMPYVSKGSPQAEWLQKGSYGTPIEFDCEFDPTEPPAVEDSAMRVILAQPVAQNGLLHEHVMENLVPAQFSRRWDMVLPSSMVVRCILIESKELRNRVFVDDDNALGPDVGDGMNIFSSIHECHVDLHALQHKKISEPIGPLRILPADSAAPVSWQEYSVTAVSSGRIDGAFIYFELMYGTPQCILHTLKDKCNTEGIVHVMRETRNIQKGESMTLSVAWSDDVVGVAIHD